MSGCFDSERRKESHDHYACKCKELISRIEKIERFFRIESVKHNNQKKPHVCPICDGFKEVYLEDFAQKEQDCYKIVPCSACEATGIVWSKN